MAVGATETVPGVSGSTVAMILGIYERLDYSLSILTTNQRKKAFPFLTVFGIGMVIGFALSIFLIGYLLTLIAHQLFVLVLSLAFYLISGKKQSIFPNKNLK